MKEVVSQSSKLGSRFHPLFWPHALQRCRQLGCQPCRRNNVAVSQCHQIRTGNGGPIVSSMDENAGTKASPGFRNHCWSGLIKHPNTRTTVDTSQATSTRSL